MTRRAVDPPPRPRRVLRVGRAARRPGAAGPAGRGRRARQPRRRRGGELRGAASSASTRRCRWRGPGARARTRCSSRPRFDAYSDASSAGDGDPARRHAARRADLARRGVPRRRRRAPVARHRTRDRRGCCAGASGPRPGSPRRSARRRRSCWPSWRATSRSPTACSWSSPGTELEFLHPLPVTRLWGVGPATRRRLDALRRRRPSATSPSCPRRRSSARSAPSAGAHLHALAWNRDDRAVEPDRVTKSIGHEETFADGPHRPRRARARRAAHGRRGRDRGCASSAKTARTVQLKVRYGDFRTITRSHTLPTPTDLAARDRRHRARPAARGRPRRRDPAARRLGAAARGRRRGAGPPGVRRRRRRSRRTTGARSRTRSTPCASGSATTRSARRRSSTGADCAPVGVPACGAPTTAPTRRHPTPDDAGGSALMLRIGLIGCGHIGTVHSFALRQLADAGLDRRRHHRDLRHRPGAGRARWPSRTARRRAASLEAAARRGRRRVDLHLDRRAPARRSRPRSPAACRSSARSRSRRRWPTAAAIAELLEPGAAPGRARAAPRAGVPRTSPRSCSRAATASRWRSSCATTSTSRSRACTARPGAATSTKAGGGTLIEHSIHDLDVINWILGPAESVSRAHRVDLRLPGHRRLRGAAARVPGRRHRVAGQRLAPGHDPAVDPPPRAVLRGGVPLDRGRLPGPAARRDLGREPR